MRPARTAGALLAACAALMPGVLPNAAAMPSPGGSHATPPSPSQLFGPLYAAVENSAVFRDSKTFADAVPRQAPASILALYRTERPRSRAQLRRFVTAHFRLPPPPPPPPAIRAARTPILTHIDRLWTELTRSTPTVPRWSSQLPLPWPYVVPGGRFRELYYWDSYFTILGLAQSGRVHLVRDMVRDFAHLIDTYGHVPNGTRTYYLSRSQPPFFFEMVSLLSPRDPARAYQRYLPELRREYAFWMRGARGLRPGQAHANVVRLHDGALLNRYWDARATPRDESYREDVALQRRSGRHPRRLFRDIRAAAESGWDFSSRWFADGRSLATIDTTQIIPVDLNSLLYGLEIAIHEGCRRAADERCAQRFAAHALRRRAAMNRYLWDGSLGAYVDYRWTRGTRLARLSAATLYPLFVSLASAAQARAVARITRRRLLAAGGLLTTLTRTGQQWDAPNGWAPLQWIAVAGLRRYGRRRLAEQIACRWMVNVNRSYRRTGELLEKYNVVSLARRAGGGEYPTQAGFGWTNGVMERLMALYPREAQATRLSACAAASGTNAHRTAIARRGALPVAARGKSVTRSAWRLSLLSLPDALPSAAPAFLELRQQLAGIRILRAPESSPRNAGARADQSPVS